MCLFPVKIKDPRFTDGEVHPPIEVACGKCLECLQQKSNEWAHRIVDECKQHDQNCFVTLTYNEANKPVDGSVSRRELQLFLKRLRKAIDVPIRFFACGEYGKKALRPHYHVIVFGWWPDDAIFWERDSKGSDLFRSPTLEKVWPKGFSSVGHVTIDSAKYCAKYLQKMQKLPKELMPPFTQMSLRPGIGYYSIDPRCLTADRVYHNGKSVKVPRYYLKVLEREGHDLTEFKERRQLHGSLVERTTNLQLRREKVQRIRKEGLTTHLSCDIISTLGATIRKSG